MLRILPWTTTIMNSTILKTLSSVVMTPIKSTTKMACSDTGDKDNKESVDARLLISQQVIRAGHHMSSVLSHPKINAHKIGIAQP